MPRIFDYKKCFETRSLVNTPPTFAIYVLGLMLNWLKAEGGVAEMHKQGQLQAKALYDVIDTSEIYENNVRREDRSKINVPFKVKDKKFARQIFATSGKPSATRVTRT